MNEIDLMSPSKVAEKYGGDKRRIAQAAQMGLLDPTVAVMAGMFIDRMRGAAAKEQTPQTTVAQDVMAQPAPAGRGLTALPSADNLYSEDSFAGGGIVAFKDQGLVEGEDSSMEGFFPFIGRAYDDSELAKLGRFASKSLADTEVARYLGPVLFGGKVKQTTPDQAREALATLSSTGKPTSPVDYSKDKKDTDTGVDLSGINLPKPTSGERTLAAVDEKKAEKAITDYAQKVKDINKKFGVSDTPDAEARAAIEKYREKLNKDLDKAGALGLIQAGLGIAGGKSRYALQNLAGASAGISEYAKAAERIRGEEKGLLDSEVKLAQAEDARRRGDAKLALELEKDAQRLALEERKTAATEKQAAKPTQFGEQYEMYAKQERDAGRTPSFEGFRKALSSGDETVMLNRMRYADTALASNMEYLKYANSKKPEDQARAQEIKNRTYAQYGVTSPAGGGQGTTLKWSDIK